MSELSYYNVYYASLSTLPRGFSDKTELVGRLQTLEHDVEEEREWEASYDAQQRGADDNNPRSVLLNKYRLIGGQDLFSQNDVGSTGSDDIRKYDVYGIQTNEASIKSLLKRDIVLDEVILVASDMVYKKSKMQLPGSKSIREMLDDKKKENAPLELSPAQLDQMQLDEPGIFAGENEEEEFLYWTNTLDYFLMELRSFCSNVLNRKMSECIRQVVIYPMDNNPGCDMMTNCAIDVATRMLRTRDDFMKVKDDCTGRDGNKADSKENNCLHLYIDSNGGKRDLIIIQIAILRALRVHGIEAEMMMYSNFAPGQSQKKITERTMGELEIGGDVAASAGESENPGDINWGKNPVEIIDKKNEYEIFDVVSGIDEFVSFGRVDKLQNYFKNSQSGIKPVLKSIEEMCGAFSTCFTDEMVNSVVVVKRTIDDFKKNQEKTQDPGNDDAVAFKLADYIVKEIETDLSAVFQAVGSVNGSNIARAKARAILPLIEWCSNKKFYQQAITLYVDRIDTWYYEKKILKMPNKRKDFYEDYMSMDCKKDEYDKWIGGIFDKVVPNSTTKSRYVDALKRAKNDGNFCFNQTKMDDIIHEIQINYDDTGNIKNIQTGLPAKLDTYFKRLKKDIKQNVSNYTSINGNLSGPVRESLGQAHADGIYLRYPKANFHFINEFKNLQCNKYEVNSNEYNQMIQVIDNMYDYEGIRKPNVPGNGFKFNADNLNLLQSDGAFTSSYKKVNDKYIDCYALHDWLDAGSLQEEQVTGKKAKPTYVEKMIHIEHYSENFADDNVLKRGTDAEKGRLSKLDTLKRITEFYLAFKIIRNNSNHSNGRGDIYALKACLWLGSEDGGNVIDLTTCDLEADHIPEANVTSENANMIRLKYETMERLLQKAIEFNKSLAC